MRPDDARHGTIAGYNAHHRDGETACQPCRQAKSAYRSSGPREEFRVALTGGNWRFDPFRRVQIWVPDPDDGQPIIACPRCKALPHETCKSKGGHRTGDHAERTIPRQCPCGVTVEGGRMYCEPCARERRLERQRSSRRTEEAA